MAAATAFVRNISLAFTPPSPALLGGAAIGLSVAIHALVFGRVTGISGHINRAMRQERPSDALLLAGLVLAGLVVPVQPQSPLHILLPFSPSRLLAAGALVAAGTSLASGCTSGHAVCGIARFSKRSLVAASTFVAVAAATSRLTSTVHTFLQQQQPLLNQPPLLPAAPAQLLYPMLAVFALQAIAVTFITNIKPRSDDTTARRVVCNILQILIGAGFALGLICSGMALPLTVASFFEFGRPTWDPSLLFVFPGALFFSALAFNVVQRGSSPCMVPEKHALPNKNAPVDLKLIVGSTLFGCGWGLAGICPGPALVLVGSALRYPALLPSILTWFGGYTMGLATVSALQRRRL